MYDRHLTAIYSAVPHRHGAGRFRVSLFEQDRPFLDALGAKARAELLALGTPRDYEPGTLLLRERSGTSYVIAILDGWAAVTTGTERGNRLILALRGAGAIVGEMAALDRGTRSATVGALDRVRAVVLTGDRFRRYLAGHPAAGELVLRQLSNRLRGADAERRALASETVLQRLAARLVELADRTGLAWRRRDRHRPAAVRPGGGGRRDPGGRRQGAAAAAGAGCRPHRPPQADHRRPRAAAAAGGRTRRTALPVCVSGYIQPGSPAGS